MTFLAELRRRNVFRVGVAYVVMAWVLLQVLDVVGAILELPAWGGKLILAILVAGFFVALFVAWAYELTPAGFRREKDVDRSHSITRQTGRRLDRIIIVLLVAAVGYLLLDKLVLQNLLAPGAGEPDTAPAMAAPAAAGPSVAVLPFVNMSGDRDNEYFSDGLTETLLHSLSQLPGLRVAARTSAFAFKGRSAAIGDIAEALGVAHVLEGSVQRAAGKVRVTAQLVRAEDGFHVWSQNYTRPLQDIFAIQDEIAADVAQALGSSLLGMNAPQRHVVSTTDLGAFDSYLEGLGQQAVYSYASLNAAEDHFKQALSLDPGFTDARLALARNYMLMANTGLIDEDVMRARATPVIDQALDREPDNLQARAYLLALELLDASPSIGDSEVQALLEGMQATLRSLPTETFLRVGVAVTLHQNFNEDERAVEILQEGLLIDPLQPELHRWLGRVYIDTHDLEQARAALERSLELAPDNPNSYGSMSDLERELDNLPGALEWTRRAVEVDPQDHEYVSNIAADLFLLRLPEAGAYWLDRLQALVPDSGLARLLEVDRAAALGETDQVIARSAAMIGDQVDTRHGAFGLALIYYTDAMLKTGQAREGYDFLVGVRPEITDFDRLPADHQGLLMQRAAIELMTGFETFENRKAAWSRHVAALEGTAAYKHDPSEAFHTEHHVMMGNHEQAVEHFLRYDMKVPLSQNLDRAHKRLYAVFAPVYEDPRVIPVLARDAARYAELREEVVAMLQRSEWNP
jgi:TolB-like protein/cytochrome c-type biogenesis protein CcmH/NrfG